MTPDERGIRRAIAFLRNEAEALKPDECDGDVSDLRHALGWVSDLLEAYVEEVLSTPAAPVPKDD